MRERKRFYFFLHSIYVVEYWGPSKIFVASSKWDLIILSILAGISFLITCLKTIGKPPELEKNLGPKN